MRRCLIVNISFDYLGATILSFFSLLTKINNFTNIGGAAEICDFATMQNKSSTNFLFALLNRTQLQNNLDKLHLKVFQNLILYSKQRNETQRIFSLG